MLHNLCPYDHYNLLRLDIERFRVLSIHLIVILLAFFTLSNTVGWGSDGRATRRKKLHKYPDVSVQSPSGNGRELGIVRWEKWERNLSFRREMGMGWKWE